MLHAPLLAGSEVKLQQCDHGVSSSPTTRALFSTLVGKGYTRKWQKHRTVWRRGLAGAVEGKSERKA